MTTGMLGFSVAEVGRGGRERTVGVNKEDNEFLDALGILERGGHKGWFEQVGKADRSPVL
jgi:hypothetical protein